MPNSKPDVIFFDVDSTLYRKESAFIPDSALKAIKEVRKRGIKTAIATGRSPSSIPGVILNLFKENMMDFIVSINGQFNASYTNGQFQAVSSYPIDKKIIKGITTYFDSKNWDYALVSDKKLAASSRASRVAEALSHIAKFDVQPDYYLDHDIYQMLIFLDGAECKTFKAEYDIPTNMELIRWDTEALDLVNNNGAKARGIKDMCAHFNLQNTMAFGDGLNDVAMFKTVNLPVAMGDAEDELKKIATYITGTVEEDGIANGLRHFGLID